MLTNDVLARLSELNRKTATPSPMHSETGAIHRDALPQLDAPESTTNQLPPGDEVQNRWGKHWLRRQPIDDIFPQWQHWLESVAQSHAAQENARSPSRELIAFKAAFPHHVLFLDLETCGFAGSMVFLVGVVHHYEQTLTLCQLLARNYGEEKAMLQTLWNIAVENRVLSTFNGKSFDWPMVHDRSTIYHLGQQRATSRSVPTSSAAALRRDGLERHDLRPELVHCDLLHHARRRWKERLPNCKLQTLERAVCGRRRTGDIPGREIPLAYHDYVRTGDAWQMRNVSASQRAGSDHAASDLRLLDRMHHKLRRTG